ncbi:hypothetical protein LOD99_3716 [Oopsacas minuta]|uniref:Arrestin C-terminal-like domain-containing protein n=1 Tax=Oopsacas minuta TaxID=111878 RepID=A0AAV7JWY1_9METZ|nr:hypothetical protein LOD99_3716 [Oopsacas minuta]
MASRDPEVEKPPQTEEVKQIPEGAEMETQPIPKLRSGQKVFKKTSPNGRITVYVGQRDFLDTGDVVEAVEGVVLVDPVYLNKDGDAKKVFCQLEGAFRYGKEELEVIGINFEKILFNGIFQVYPPSGDEVHSNLQRRLIRKLGENAHPFRFTIPPGLSPSLILQGMPGEPDRQCGIDYQLKSYIARQANEKPEKKRMVSLTIKKLTHAPADSMPNRPTLDVKKEYMLSSNPIHVEANLDKAVYYHGEEIKINVSITNASSRQIRRIKLSARQFTEICWSVSAQYKRVVAELESADGFPLLPGSSCQRTYTLTPLFKKCKEKRGLAVDGHLRDEDTLLASSTIFPPAAAQLAEYKEKYGIIVRYMIKVTLVVALSTDLKLNLPFLLTHPKPPPPPEPVTAPKAPNEPEKLESLPPAYDALDPKPKQEDLIQFDSGPDDSDFVFEEFIRFRVSGDTDA